jgi:23S rRNA (cytosine1962-C5)-methyltransferase
MSVAQVVLQPRRARPFYGRHPWVYPGAISTIEGNPADGDEVDLLSYERSFVARGLFNSQSKIRVRLYSWSPDETLDKSFFEKKIESAIRLRHEVLGLSEPSEACRLVFSEADGLSGCIVDRYGRWLVVQFTSLALAQRREMFAELLVELVQPEGIYLRTERDIGKLEGLELQDGPLWGTVPEQSIIIEEHGIRFKVNLAEGQKTGFYIDQRDNRQAVAHLARGRRVLDAFCYTGGFALHAAKAGATEAVGIDVSESAIALASSNAQLNGLPNVKFERADVFAFLTNLVQKGEKYTLVVLDPPKFARNRSAIDEALRGYRRLYLLSLRLLDSDGILVSCCCSGLISQAMLAELLAQCAAEAGRHLQILEWRGQSPDHPVAATCLESNYLKCLISRVD